MPATLTFFGAAETVTGSRYLVEAAGKKVLVDCGMFQGYKSLRLRNWQPFPVAPHEIASVLITHAHLDHSGFVPALVRQGYRGEILMTHGSFELCKILWADSAQIFEEDAERANRKGYTKHQPAKALFDMHDVEQALKQVRVVRFDEQLEITPEVKATFLHAGHILGAAQILLEVDGTRLHFTGDLGRADDELMRPPAPYPGSDILVAEATYGDRKHPDISPEAELAPILSRVLDRGGTVVIPAFAVGRTQSLLLHIWRLMQRGEIPKVPIYLNSPMATRVTELYEQHREEHKIDAHEFDVIYDVAEIIRDPEESKRLNQNQQPKIIIAGSGMITGGRVVHHIAKFGRDPKNAIVLSGYQAGGTRGALLLEGVSTIRIFGEDVPIEAEVFQLETLSAHVDAQELIDWMRQAGKPRMVYLTHGEPSASDRLRFRLDHELGVPVRVASHAETVDLNDPK